MTFGDKDAKVIWDEKTNPLKEGEELVFDNSAYEMLHRAKVEWPCLSIDFLIRERISTPDRNTYGSYKDWFP